MANRRRYRGRRPGQSAGEPGAAGEGGSPEQSAPRLGVARAEAGDENTAAAGERGPRRRRRRGGRGSRPEGGFEPGSGESREGEPRRSGEATAAGEAAVGFQGRGMDESGGSGATGDGARKRRRRRGGRGRRPAGEGVQAEPFETPEGELPADYISIPVERGTAFLFEPAERSLVSVEDEEEEERAGDRKPRKAKRINAGKLFWYLRTKSYVPIPELRRRFEIPSDEMATIQDDGRKVYIGLPQDIAEVVANLRRQQKIGLECSADFTAP